LSYLKKGLSLAILFFVTSLSARSENPAIPFNDQQFTHATWYAGYCVGRTLAGGKRYTKDAVFVATRQPYPFGTKLRITNLYNHRSIIVSVEDREPYNPGRALDLSYAAAKQLDMISMGVVLVSYSKVMPTDPEKGFAR
jgi:rare lipoprotein A